MDPRLRGDDGTVEFGTVLSKTKTRLPMADYKVCDRVRLVKLEEWFFKHIPTGDVAFLKSCVGRETEIIGFDDYRHPELEFVRSAVDEDYASHTVWVDQS